MSKKYPSLSVLHHEPLQDDALESVPGTCCVQAKPALQGYDSTYSNLRTTSSDSKTRKSLHTGRYSAFT
ncbi:hypothetical protein VTN00DRAFT_495 [Thermoascus crustaceus]|uniref:uncharacterized protein n=1 Tax=Thermoascus crustaceus TaxID=5088 RepID=UPI003742C9B0